MIKVLYFDVAQCVYCVFGVICKKSLPKPMYKDASLFSSKGFIVVALTFRSLIRFELIFYMV